MSAVLPAYRYGPNLLVWCQHERSWHAHGAAGGTGHRTAHCRCANSPHRPGGYRLVDAGPLTDDIRARHRVGTRCECGRAAR